MGAINGRVIYSPKGKAGEYAENAANFFVGCPEPGDESEDETDNKK